MTDNPVALWAKNYRAAFPNATWEEVSRAWDAEIARRIVDIKAESRRPNDG